MQVWIADDTESKHCINDIRLKAFYAKEVGNFLQPNSTNVLRIKSQDVEKRWRYVSILS